MTTSSQQIQFRQRNRTYYADLERLHQLLVPPGLRVLEVGCGTGDLLAYLQPAHGLGSSSTRRWPLSPGSGIPNCGSWRPTPKR